MADEGETGGALELKQRNCAFFLGRAALFCRNVGIVALISCLSTTAQSKTVHGLWVWKGPSIVAEPQGVEKLRDFCQSESVNEVYVSISSHGAVLEGDFPKLIETLHRSNVRVEALLSSNDADEAGAHREKLLEEVRQVLRFNEKHPNRAIDGIHLDIEPQQRPENKGEGNLRFLSGLVDAYKEVRRLSEPAGLKVNADIQTKLLKGELAQRKLLLSSLPKLTLMLYEISGRDEDSKEKAEKLRTKSHEFLAKAYEGLQGADLAKMVIGLRTPDYGALLPEMLKLLDEANSTNAHYAGWARHS